MVKIRPVSELKHHNLLAVSATSWQELGRSSKLRAYGFRQGISHLVQSDKSDLAASLLKDFKYGMARVESLQDAASYPYSQDAAALVRIQSADENLRAWEEFLRTRAHLLAVKRDWATEKAFLQFASETAEDSPIRAAAETWLRDGHCDWIWLKRARQVEKSTPSPCVQVLKRHEAEIALLGVWRDHLMSLDCWSSLYIWDKNLREPIMVREADGFSVDNDQHLIFWFENKIYRWQTEMTDAIEMCRFSDEQINQAKWISSTMVLVSTLAGRLYSVDLSSGKNTLLDSHGHIIIDITVINEENFAYRLGPSIDDENPDDDDEDDDDEDDDNEDDDDEDEDDDDEDDDDEDDDDEDDNIGPPEIYFGNLHDSAYSTRSVDSPFPLKKLFANQNILYSIRENGVVETWDSDTKICSASWTCPTGTVSDFCFHQSYIAVWTDTEIYLLDESLSIRTGFFGHSDSINAVVSLDHQHIASCADDGEIRVWNTRNASLVHAMRNESPHGILGIEPLEDGRCLTWGFDNFMSIWNWQNATLETHVYGHTSSVERLVRNSSGLFVTHGFFENIIRVWDVDKARQHLPLENHTDVVVFAQPRGNQLITGSHDQTLRTWTIEQARYEKSCRGHAAPVENGFWLTDKHFVSSSWDGSIILWDILNGEPSGRFEGHNDRVVGVVNWENARLLSWSDDCTLRIWDRRNGDCLHVLNGHQAGINGGFFVKNGLWLSWSAEDKSCRLWDLESAKCTKVFRGHKWPLARAALLPDDLIVTWDEGNDPKPAPTIMLWDVMTGNKVHTFRGAHEPIVSITKSQEVLWALYASEECYCWDLSTNTRTRFHIRELETIASGVLWQLFSSSPSAGTMNQVVAHGTHAGVDLRFAQNVGPVWLGDGEWRVHHVLECGTVIASCWNDLAFLRLMRGHERIRCSDLPATNGLML